MKRVKQRNSGVIWVGKKCHVTYKVWSSPLSFPSDTKTQLQCNSAGLFFFRHARHSAHLCFCFCFVLFFLVCFFSFSRVTVTLSLVFTIPLTHAPLKFAQEHVKHMIYYLHGEILKQTCRQQGRFICIAFV